MPSNAALRTRTVTLPAAALQSRGRSDDRASLANIVQEFNATNAPLAFAVDESAAGLHVIPKASSLAQGTEKVTSLLDETVIILPERRTPMGHIAALASAISLKAGIRVEASSSTLGFGVDQLYLQADAQTMPEWGTNGLVKARDGLQDFLSRSATSLSWRLNCQPTPPNGAPFCVLNIDPIRVERRAVGGKVERTVLMFDRCVRCKPLTLPLSQ